MKIVEIIGSVMFQAVDYILDNSCIFNLTLSLECEY